MFSLEVDTSALVPQTPSVLTTLAAQKSSRRLSYSSDGLKKLGKILRDARELKGLSLDNMAVLTGYSRSSIAILETGRKNKSEEINNVNVPLLLLLRDLLEPINPETCVVYHPWDLLKISLDSDY